MTQKEKIIYLAGIMDADGCLKIYHRNNRGRREGCRKFVVSNTSKELIDWLYKNFGGWRCPVKREGNRKLQYRWELRSEEILDVLPQILPYLIVKKEDAKIQMNYLKNRKHKGNSLKKSRKIK